jgi:hypothetical protein
MFTGGCQLVGEKKVWEFFGSSYATFSHDGSHLSTDQPMLAHILYHRHSITELDGIPAG